MNRSQFTFLITMVACTTLSGPAVHAQQKEPIYLSPESTAQDLVVRTISLKHLGVKDAARLVAPYLQSPRSGAFEGSSDLDVITIRGTAEELQQAVAVLTEYDRAPRTVRLKFQIIEPTDSPTADSRISSVSGALRELFAAPGYRLLGEGMVLTDESQQFDVGIATGRESLHVVGNAQRAEQSDSAVGLQVYLYQHPSDLGQGMRPLFKGSLSAGFGRMVVLGSAAPMFFTDSTTVTRRTIILTVRPELVGGR